MFDTKKHIHSMDFRENFKDLNTQNVFSRNKTCNDENVEANSLTNFVPSINPRKRQIFFGFFLWN